MKNLKELREYNNLSQKEVAEHIGVCPRVYSYYEHGRKLPAKYIKPLANLFCISCDELLENKDKYKCMWCELQDWLKERMDTCPPYVWEDFEEVLCQIKELEKRIL